MVGPRRADLHARGRRAGRLGPSALGRAAHHLRRSGQLASWAETAEIAADRAVDLGHDDEAVPLYDDLLRHAPLTGERRGRIAVKFARASIESLRAPDVEPVFEAIEIGVSPWADGELRLLAAITVDWADPRPAAWTLRRGLPGLDERPSLQAWAMGCLGMPAGRGAPVCDHLHWVDRSLDVLPRVDDPDLAMASTAKPHLLARGRRPLLAGGRGAVPWPDGFRVEPARGVRVPVPGPVLRLAATTRR